MCRVPAPRNVSAARAKREHSRVSRVTSHLSPTRRLCGGRAHACVRMTCPHTARPREAPASGWRAGAGGPDPRPASEAREPLRFGRELGQAAGCRHEAAPSEGSQRQTPLTAPQAGGPRPPSMRPRGAGEVPAPSWASVLGGPMATFPLHPHMGVCVCVCALTSSSCKDTTRWIRAHLNDLILTFFKLAFTRSPLRTQSHSEGLG